MKEIIKYKTEDGREFLTIEMAQKHERLLEMAKRVNDAMPLKDDPGCNFANGHGYYQRTDEQVGQFIRLLTELIREECGPELAQSFSQKPRNGYVGRYLDDGNSVSYGPFMRLYCTDSQNREFGQPFYAMNPDKAELFEIK